MSTSAAWTLCLALTSLAGVGLAGDVLRIETTSVPRQVPAGATAPLEITFTVVEALRSGWRVSAELAHVDGKGRFVKGPVKSQFGPDSAAGTTRTYSFAIPIPEDAAPGTYRVIVDHYDKVDGKWVHVAYADKDGEPTSVVVGQIEVLEALPPRPLPAPQRRLRPGEVHRVLECEEFGQMDGRGEDLGIAQGWTWYRGPHYSGLRAAANNTGQGTIRQTIDPPLPAGKYKLLVKAASPFCTVRVGLGDDAIEATPPRNGWTVAGVVDCGHPVDNLWLEAVNKVGSYIIVDSVYVTSDLQVQATESRSPSRQFLPRDAKPVKTRRTVWTQEFVAAARARMQKHPAVSKAAQGIITSARDIATHSDEILWQLLADTSIQRQYYVNQNKGCPICGLKIKEHDVFHPWIFDPIKRPFKMQCPSCKTVFPTNDFAAGETEGGKYPDDGTGCKIGEDTYSFIGEYVHFTYRSYFLSYLKTLSQAIALTDDAELAHKAGVMLLRAAQQYPNSEDRQQRALKRQWGHRSGCITDSIWSSYEGLDYGWAYDAVWPFLDKDEELLELAKAHVPEITDHEQLRLYIEENLLRRIGQAYCDEAIIGNPGYHHKGMAWLMLALDDMDSQRFPNCTDLLEYLYYRIYGALRYFPNLLGRDGSSLESPGYNASRLNMVDTIAVMERFFTLHPGARSERYPDLWEDPRFASQFDYYTDYMLLDRWLPTVGDSSGGPIIPKREPAHKLSIVSPSIAARAWQRYRTPKLAMLAYGYDNEAPKPGLWSDLPLEQLAAARKQAPERLQRKTNIQDDYGLVFLRSGEGSRARVLWGWYGRTLSHAHDDLLMIGLTGKELDLLPDLGYPKSWEHAGRWEANSLTHNTMVVDGNTFPPGRNRGRLTLLGPLPGLQVAQMQAGDLSGEGEVSQRTMLLVDIDEEDFYAVDLLDVRAGTEHCLSYHGPQADVTVTGTTLTTQERGTVAGEDIEYGQPVGRQGDKESHSPLAHMMDVQRAEPEDLYAVDYDLGDRASTHVRLHQMPDKDTSLALGTGRPPSQPEAYHVRYCLQQRRGERPLAGRYITVVEPYCDKPVLQRITRPVRGSFGAPEALIVEHGQTRDILLLGPEGGGEAQAGGAALTGRVAMVRLKGGQPVLLSAYGFSSLNAPGVSVSSDSAFMHGEIVSCAYDHQALTVRGVPADPSWVGMPIRIHNDLHSTMHVIAGVAEAGELTELTLTTTALRHEGWASGIAAGSIRDGAPSPWAFDTYLAGTRLIGEGNPSQWMVTGAAGGWWSAPTGTRISLQSPDGEAASAHALHQALADADGDGVAQFRLQEYGPGDRVEVASFMRLERGQDGQWTGIRSPGVRVTVEP